MKETVGVGRLALRHAGGVQLLAYGARIVIGRGEGSHVRLDDAQVSRQHAVITVDDLGTFLEDLGSANGTYVDGRRVTERTPLRLGARIQIGAKMLAIVRATRDDIQTIRDHRAWLGGATGATLPPPPGPSTTHGDVMAAEAMLAGCESLVRRREWAKAAPTFDDALDSIVDRARRHLPLPARAHERVAACATAIAGHTGASAPLERLLELHTLTGTVPDTDRLAEAARLAGGLRADSPSLSRYLSAMRQRPLTFTQRLHLRRLEQLAG